ncbi:hypothetical protein [Kaarinaea lacus]
MNITNTLILRYRKQVSRRFFQSGYLHYTLPVFLLAHLLVSGCSNPVNYKNSHIQSDAEDTHIAKVYFLRPMPVKYKGIADNKLRVDFNKEKLLTLNEGQYALVKLEPSKGKISTHSRTKFIGSPDPINVSRDREYRFIAGKTYFIHLQRVDEEFRGIFYDPAPITFQQALKLSTSLHAVGDASDEPIDEITSIKEAPQPSQLTPAFPEELYPGKPYLIKGNPDYQAPDSPQTVDEKNEMTFDSATEKTDDTNK